MILSFINVFDSKKINIYKKVSFYRNKLSCKYLKNPLISHLKAFLYKKSLLAKTQINFLKFFYYINFIIHP